MTEVFLILAFIAFILLTTVIICIVQEIDELKEKLEQYHINLKYLNSCELEHESRINQLEEALELKEFYEQELFNEKGNENNKTISRNNSAM